MGFRLGWWGLGAAFTILRVSVYVAIIVAVVALIGAVLALMTRHWVSVVAAGFAILLAVGTAAVPLAMQRTARSVPAIHDITTDTEHPPDFVTLRAIRERTPNGVVYGGASVATEQKRAYPDLTSLQLPIPPDRAFALVEATAKSLGWDVASTLPTEGRLEATDTMVRVQGRRGRASRLRARGKPRRHSIGLARRPERSRRQCAPGPRLPERAVGTRSRLTPLPFHAFGDTS